ncbi:MAG: DNA polymerase III subunit beta [Candidatus Pacebacteria bacterium]|nr:DNA polymerase III subunit beta [Candidatus Paceibacterota bacterium]
MKLTVSKEALSGALKKVLSAVNVKTTIPVLNNVLLQADDNGLTIAATDLEVYLRSTIEANTEQPGKTTLPARKFGQIVNALPDGDVCLETNDTEQTAISCSNAYFRLLGLNAEEFPSEEETAGDWEFTLPADEFRKILSKIQYAASTDETRHVLNGLLLTIRSGILTAVATDGRRLALIERPLDGDGVTDCDVILPPKVVGELVKILDGKEDLTVQFSESRAAFLLGQTLIVSKLVEGNYPNYRQVIPSNFSQSAVFPRDPFAAALNRVAMVVSETSASLSLSLEKAKATLSANSAEVGEGSEPLEVSYDGETVNISFNPDFLMDPLRHLEAEQVVLQFNDQYSPVSISGDEGFLYVIMPMRS